jgi:midasin (ATPase involved in ribosome maturation)
MQDLDIGRKLNSEFSKGAKFENLCRAYNLTKTRCRILMLEASRADARNAGAVAGASERDVQDKVTQAACRAAEESVRRTLDELYDSTTLREMVQDEVAKYPPQTGELKVTLVEAQVSTTIKHSHGMLKESLRRVAAGFQNLLMVGPAGSGKTTLADQMAQSLKRKFGFLSLSGGTTEGQLLGRVTSTGKYLSAMFVELFENGGVFLLDEVDAADPNVLLVLNSALANGQLAVPARVKKPVATRHKDFVLVCAANTWGTGADWQYVGRNQLDAAFLSRFAGAVLEVSYDETLERALTAEPWYNEFVAVRAAAQLNRLRRILGTREMLAGQKLLKAGYTSKETWTALTAGWTPDERSKARILA